MMFSTLRRRVFNAWKPDDAETAIGAVVVKMGCATQHQVEDAVREQHPGEPIGRTMVRRGVLTERQLEIALGFQERMRAGGAIGVMKEILQWRTEKAFGHRGGVVKPA